jgi:hypothetical protein
MQRENGHPKEAETSGIIGDTTVIWYSVAWFSPRFNLETIL